MKLDQFMTETDSSLAVMAEKVGVTREAIRLWAAGERTPRPKWMRKIAEATEGKVTPNDFLDPPAPADHGRAAG